MGNSSTLEVIKLHENSLTSHIPDDISDLSHLRDLHLARNSACGEARPTTNEGGKLALLAVALFEYLRLAERSVNRGRFLVTTPGDIRSENADMSNEKSCEKHDRLPVEELDSFLNVDQIRGQTRFVVDCRPMCALDPVTRAVLCALLGCYGETLCQNDEESSGTPPNHVLNQHIMDQAGKVPSTSHTWEANKGIWRELQITNPVRDALRINGIYPNKEYIFENENMQFSCEICYSEYGRDDMDDYGEYLMRYSIRRDREMKLAIDLAPETKPVTRAFHKMAPVKMRKLAKQMQEMLEEGAIRPSVPHKKGLDVIKTTEELIDELERVESEVQILKGDNT
ncbi:hypothetical protein AgCh_009277 [Apium graveolens]